MELASLFWEELLPLSESSGKEVLAHSSDTFEHILQIFSI